MLVTGHGAPGGQDDDDRQPGPAAGGLGREDDRRRLRPAARAAPPAPGRCPRAGLHRLLRAQGAARLAREADLAPNLFVLTAGTLPPNPPALLARKQLGELFAGCARGFEWVLIDSPPIASVTDALLLARHADHTLLVVQHNKVDKRLVKRSISALRKVTPNLLGAVLNVVDVRSRSYHYYYYPQGERTRGGRRAGGQGRHGGAQAGDAGGRLRHEVRRRAARPAGARRGRQRAAGAVGAEAALRDRDRRSRLDRSATSCAPSRPTRRAGARSRPATSCAPATRCARPRTPWRGSSSPG